jgi:hypothetical protein
MFRLDLTDLTSIPFQQVHSIPTLPQNVAKKNSQFTYNTTRFYAIST